MGYSIYNIRGQVVFSGKLSGQTREQIFELPAEALERMPSGVYLISLERGNNTIATAMHPAVHARLLDVPTKHKLPIQIEIAPGRTGTDADAIHDLKGGAAMAVVGIPNRYMHSPNEVISLKDLDAAVKLITEFVLSLDDKFKLER